MLNLKDEIYRELPQGEPVHAADRPYGQQITFEKCRELLHTVFRGILPGFGYTVRNGEIVWADNILNAIRRRYIVLAEAETGAGTTLAYLAAAILAKRGRLNDYHNKAYYPRMSYIDMAQMPIVITASYIALQKVILSEYIPALSEFLVEHGLIKTPVTAVLRKGRKHYVCEHRLRSCLKPGQNEKIRRKLRELLAPQTTIDLAEIQGLDHYTQRKISVPDKCLYGCPYRDHCAYLRFREHANSSMIDIQVVNHSYFLADLKLRAGNQRPLIPNYQTVIIDDAPKFLSAARTFFGAKLSSFTLPELKDMVYKLNLESESAQILARKTAKKIFDESVKLFKGLDELSRNNEATPFIVIDRETVRHLRNLRDIAERLDKLLMSEPVRESSRGKKSAILWNLAIVRRQLASLTGYSEHICRLEKPDINSPAGTNQEIQLCAIPQNLDTILYESLWSRGIPTMLTPGTSLMGRDIKKNLGLEKLGNNLMAVQ